MTVPKITARLETWPIAGSFRISRGAKTEAAVVVAEVVDGDHVGRGECVPYARYGETPATTMAQILSVEPATDRARLEEILPGSAARNALDCALWDLEAKRTGITAAQIAGLAPLRPLSTFFTISLDTPETMAKRAAELARFPLLKLKLGAADGRDADRMRAVRLARPEARLAVDANEGWSLAELRGLFDIAAEVGIEVIEQPLPADADAALGDLHRSVPVCADESVHTRPDLAPLRNRYDAVNIKLDKAGGLTEALRMAEAARQLGFKLMVGSMVATSLSMAPAFLLAQRADWVDLDGPLLLERDRPGGLTVADGKLSPPSSLLWG